VVGVGVSSIHSDRGALCARTQPTGIEAGNDSWRRSRDCYLAGVGMGLGFYFFHFGEVKFSRFFGFLAAPAVFMTWLYCSATAILIGAEINSRLTTAKEQGGLFATHLPPIR